MQRRNIVALLVALGGVAIVSTLAVVADSSAQYLPQDPEYNNVDYWQSNGYEYCVKYEPVTTPYMVPPAPEGGAWDLLVIKAGAGDQANQLVEDPVAGTTYTHSSDKDISHVILCVVTYPASTTTSTTTSSTTSSTVPTSSTSEPTSSTTSSTVPTSSTSEPTSTSSTTESTTSTTESTTTTEPVTTTSEPVTTTTEPVTTTSESTTTTEPVTSTSESTTTTEPVTTTSEPVTTTTEPVTTTSEVVTTTTAEVLGTTTIVTVPGDTTPPPAPPPPAVAGATVQRSAGPVQPAPQELATTGLETDRLVTALLLIASGALVVGLARRARRRQG